VAGCSDGKSSVSGSVTLDGRPVASGAITFVKRGGEVVREGAIIKDGAFQALVPPGTYKLELNGQKVTGTRKQKGFDGKDEEVQLTEELFPERYNAKSNLTQEIKPGSNTVKLDLKN
jgi:hypothetical protein